MKPPVDKKKKYRKQKVNTYVSAADVERLSEIAKKYKYNSIYHLLQYLIHCFLRVADPEVDPIDETIPDEISEMFTQNSEWEERNYTYNSHQGMVMRKRKDQRKIKNANDL